MKSNMAKRVGFAVVAIPVVLSLVWYGGLPLALLVAAAGWLGAGELLGFAKRQQVRPWSPAVHLLAGILPLVGWAVMVQPETRDGLQAQWPFIAGAWVLVVLLATLARLGPEQRPLSAAGLTLLAPLYAGGLPAFLLAIRHAGHGERSWEGTALVFFPMVTVWICDSVAMTVGKRVGGPKLAPVVSPNKTWSGTVGGFIGALAVAPLYELLVFRPLHMDISPWHLLVVAAVIGVFGQLGDLAESLFKREAGLKDSSHLIPGHGGVLDRLDSLYFAIPLTAGLFRLFGII
jgi:phosphatidate cytidylyltransferase